MNQNILHIIEHDDIDNFKIIFDIQTWQNSITSIANYAGTSEYHPEIHYVDCDCLKYSVHCNADKIFSYLLPLVDTNKHGDNYGWPLLSMAIKNGRYDYAKKIISHPSFNYYSVYHVKCFIYIDKQPKTEEHIDFLFDYLKKFHFYDFTDRHLIYHFTHLICFNEDTFTRFNHFYHNLHSSTQSVLDIFEDHYSILADEILSRKFNPFILEQLNSEQLEKMILSVMDDSIIFIPLFESIHAKQGLSYLLKHPTLIQEYLNQHQVIINFLPLEGILLLIENGIDIWRKNDEGLMPLDYILQESELNNEKTLYFLNHYTQKIYDILETQGDKNNLYKYCHHKLLKKKLPIKNHKTMHYKV